MSDEQALTKRDLPEPVLRRGILEAQWLTLVNNLYPGANPKSVLMVWDYCAARNLDPLKKPCHIVPMEVKVGESYEWRDVVMPGIYEYRTTAHRTGEYLGHDEPIYGPDKDCMGVLAPEWCLFTVYRWNATAKLKVPFPVKTFFAEVVATKKDRDTRTLRANARWSRAPKQMLTKCAEAAALREAFPEEIGGEPTADEMDGQRVILDVTPQHEPAPPTPAVSALERLPEPLQQKIGEMFELLHASPALRITKLNEFLGAESERSGQTAEDAATALLEWGRDEYAKQKTGQPRKSKDDNGKKVQAPAVQTVHNPPTQSGGDSGGRPSGAEPVEDAALSSASKKPVTAAEIGW